MAKDSIGNRLGIRFIAWFRWLCDIVRVGEKKGIIGLAHIPLDRRNYTFTLLVAAGGVTFSSFMVGYVLLWVRDLAFRSIQHLVDFILLFAAAAIVEALFFIGLIYLIVWGIPFSNRVFFSSHTGFKKFFKTIFLIFFAMSFNLIFLWTIVSKYGPW